MEIKQNTKTKVNLFLFEINLTSKKLKNVRLCDDIKHNEDKKSGSKI